MIALLLACASPGTWSEARALAPALARLDADGDGTLSAAEFASAAHGVSFAMLDTDSSGQITTAELAAWMRKADPLTFDGQFGRPTPTRTDQHDRDDTLDDLLRFLAAELAARGGPAPSATAIQQAAATGQLDSPEVQQLLRTLAADFADAELPFPEGLLL